MGGKTNKQILTSKQLIFFLFFRAAFLYYIHSLPGKAGDDPAMSKINNQAHVSNQSKIPAFFDPPFFPGIYPLVFPAFFFGKNFARRKNPGNTSKIHCMNSVGAHVYSITPLTGCFWGVQFTFPDPDSHENPIIVQLVFCETSSDGSLLPDPFKIPDGYCGQKIF